MQLATSLIQPKSQPMNMMNRTGMPMQEAPARHSMFQEGGQQQIANHPRTPASNPGMGALYDTDTQL